jgi:hypothetical protein
MRSVSSDDGQARLASHMGILFRKGTMSLRQRWSGRANVFLARIETQSAMGEELWELGWKPIR